MKIMRVSVALATYQGERFLPAQLQSYLDQSRLPDELCVSDDSSTDATVCLIEEFRQRAPFPVKLVSPAERLGSNRNFEYAAMNCTGDIILFSDQDDVWLRQHIELLAASIERDDQIMAVASNSTYVNEELVPTGVDTQQSERFSNAARDSTIRMPRNQFQRVLQHRISAGHGMAFRASILPLLVPFSRNWIYDQWVFILAAAAGFVTYTTVPLTLHRQHARQDVGNRRLELQEWADRSAGRSQESEQKDENKWRELLTRVGEHRDLLKDPDAAAHALEQKLQFIARRARVRRSPLPMRIALTTRELLTGNYHRWGRGMLTFSRDLYGNRS